MREHVVEEESFDGTTAGADLPRRPAREPGGSTTYDLDWTHEAVQVAESGTIVKPALLLH